MLMIPHQQSMCVIRTVIIMPMRRVLSRFASRKMTANQRSRGMR